MENNEKDTEKILGMNRTMFFIIIILLCILSLSIGIYAQVFYRYSKTDPFMLGIGVGRTQDAAEITKLKNEFSTIFTNSALAITISLLGYMGSSVINMLALHLKLNWIKYFVTPNWNLTEYFWGGIPTFEGITLPFSIAIIVIYMVIILVKTFIIYQKKNIKNI